MSPRRRRTRGLFGSPAREQRRLPHAALLILTAFLAAAVGYLTWPARAAIFCERLPQLTALAACAAALLVLAFRALSTATRARSSPQSGLQSGPGPGTAPQEDRRIAGGAAILAALAFFLAAHFIAQYRRPCADVQQQVRPPQPTQH